jgi:hypothetical protein
MRLLRTKRAAKRLRFHAFWLALLMMLVDVLAAVWSTFDGLLPISPWAFAILGFVFAIASGVGHLLINKD